MVPQANSSNSASSINTPEQKLTPKQELFTALDNGNEKEIQNVIKKYKIRINSQDSSGNTLLHYAVMTGNESSVKALLDLKADPSIRNNEQLTPLAMAKVIGGDIADYTAHYLDEKLRTEMIRIEPQRMASEVSPIDYGFAENLMKGGANPYSKNEQGESALDLAKTQKRAPYNLSEFLEAGIKELGITAPIITPSKQKNTSLLKDTEKIEAPKATPDSPRSINNRTSTTRT